MGSYLVKLLTNPENFKFYAGNTEGQVGSVSTPTFFGQKSIPYGKDRPGGGDSGQPFIPKNLQVGVKNSSFYNDFVIRGGVEAPLSAAEDIARLTKYFVNIKNPGGLLFVAKQNLLSRVGTKTEASFGYGYLGGFLNEGAYTPLSTIAQAGVGWAGGHLNKQGLDPTGLLSFETSGLVAKGGTIPPTKYPSTFGINSEGETSRNGRGDSFAIRKYGDVVYDNNLERNNNTPPEAQYIVPEAEYRKANRASSRLERKIQRTEASNKKYQQEQNKNPKKFTKLTDTYKSVYDPLFNFRKSISNAVTSPVIGAETQTGPTYNPASPNLAKFEKKVNSFLVSFDQYRDDQLAKKVSRRELNQRAAEGKLLSANAKLDAANIQADANYLDALREASLSRTLYANRLLDLWDTRGLNQTSPVYTSTPEIYSYGGGPGSVLGVGKTTIKFATLNDGTTPARTGVNMVDPYRQYGRRAVEYKTTNMFGSTYTPGSYGSVSLSYAEIYDTSITEEDLFGVKDYLVTYNNKPNLQTFNPENVWQNSKTSISTWSQVDLNSPFDNPEFNQLNVLDRGTLEDFRKRLDVAANPTFLSVSPSYKLNATNANGDSISGNIEKRINYRNPSRRGNISNYQAGKRDTLNNARLSPVDYINAFPIYQADQATNNELTKDLIDFRIGIYDNNTIGVGNTIQLNWLHFRVFLDDFSDSYDAEWKGIEYMGRGEKFYRYTGFKRDVGIKFTIAAASKEELIPIYKKLNYLASSTAPYYSENGYMSGNLSRITLGGWLVETPGFISSVDLSIPDESPWEVNVPILTKSDPNVKQLPHMVQVTLKFTPIHTTRPRINNLTDTPKPANISAANILNSDTTVYGTTGRFIKLEDSNGNSYDTKPSYKNLNGIPDKFLISKGLFPTNDINDLELRGLPQEQTDEMYNSYFDLENSPPEQTDASYNWYYSLDNLEYVRMEDLDF